MVDKAIGDVSKLSQLPPAKGAAVERPKTTPVVGNPDATSGEKWKKTKASLSSLFSLIEYGYSRKGQRITVKSASLRVISANTALTDENIARLHQLAALDKVFAVPRQLLLLARELRETPKVRSGLCDFVRTLL